MNKVGSDFEYEIIRRKGATSSRTDTDSHEDLGALFDSILDEMRAEEQSATDRCKSERKRRQVLPESAASVEEALMDDVNQRLRQLLPRIEARAAEGVEFDEELYQELKPLLAAILDEVLKERR